MFFGMVEHRLPDPSEFSALDLQGEFRRFAICSTSTTIEINRSIFSIRHPFSGVKTPSARLRYALVEPLSGGVISQAVGVNDLRDPPDAGTCDHCRPFVRRD
jgi:hypothetical protein